MKKANWVIPRGEQRKVFKFPDDWTKEQVTSFVNDNIKICPYCNKVDIRLDHLNDCNYVIETKEEHQNNLFK